MKFRKGEEEDLRLGITPLIDIVFLLLIFFMLTSHFDVASGVLIKLPKVVQRAYTTDTPKITVLIDAKGRTFLKGKELNQEALASTLRDLVEQKGLIDLVLQADQEARHGKVVEVMDAAKTAGVRSIVIAARWNPGEG